MDLLTDPSSSTAFKYNKLDVKRSRRNKHAARQHHVSPSNDGEARNDRTEMAKLLQIIREKRKVLTAGKTGREFKRHLSFYFSLLRADHSDDDETTSRLPTRIYALGIGQVSQSRSAQVQLALMLEMADHIAGIVKEDQSDCDSSDSERTSCSSASANPPGTQGGDQCPTRPSLMAYDPLFTAEDEGLLTALGVKALTRDEASPQACYDYTFQSLSSSPGSRPGRSTLLFMPHCPRLLSERYLRSFWQREALLQRRVTFCWNRAGRYAEFLSDETLRQESPCFYRIIPHLKTFPLPPLPHPNSEALSDLAFEFAFSTSTPASPQPPVPALSSSSHADLLLNEAGLIGSISRLQVTEFESDQQDGEPNSTASGDEIRYAMTPPKRNKKKRQQKRRSDVDMGIYKEPNIQSDEFWQLPPAVEGGTGSEEIL